jgi:hypothetical protein
MPIYLDWNNLAIILAVWLNLVSQRRLEPIVGEFILGQPSSLFLSTITRNIDMCMTSQPSRVLAGGRRSALDCCKSCRLSSGLLYRMYSAVVD